jgi:hypothetical protein
MLEIRQMSNFDPRKPGDCKEYNNKEFEKCVDKELQDLWKPVFGCNPPWLSHQDKCTGVINATNEERKKLYDKPYHTLNRILHMETYPARDRCIKPCTVTTTTVYLNEKVKKGKDTNKYAGSTLSLKINPMVVHKTKILAYRFSDFLTDMGSSLGLWFGLSVFGITDLAITAYHFKKTIGEKVLRAITYNH